ncbi:MAG TPA: outer membrane protein assembly factor BamA [Gemmatimonadales bacterium]|nr:outer membrane protein assembly factor BamA [Gemmatimonadales bacterium]
MRSPWAAGQQRPVLVKELVVEGNRRVQEAVILSRVQTRIGAPFNPSQLSDDLRSIFALGFFDDVQAKVEDFEGGIKVILVVMERPFVRDVEFVGNKKLATSDLQDQIDIRLGSVYNPVEVRKAQEKLHDYYEQSGYFEVKITPETERLSGGDVKVIFTIDEGRRIKIDRIVINGNQGLSDRQIKKVLVTQEREYFFLRGTLQRQKLDEEVERILSLYNDHGYIQARVEGYDISVDRDKARVTVTFSIVEGPQYRVDQVRIQGVTLFPDEEVRRLVRLKPGDIYSRSKLRESVGAIADLFSSIGRAAADVIPRSEPFPATAKVNLTFDIVEGPEVYVERINISGNTRSQDKILRREIPMAEGDLFTLQKLQRARQRLINLGYFETVEASTAPGADRNRIIVNINVVERPTGIFSIGGGFSSVDNLIGTIDLSQRNFLGRGWEATLRIRVGGTTQQGIISFTEPWLFDRPLSAGFDLFNLRRVYDEYDYDSLGGGLRMSHPFAEYWRWHTGYRLTRDEVDDVVETASAELQAEEGVRVTSLVSGALIRDSRDNILAPTRGGHTSMNLDVAGLGGDSQYIKTVASTSYFQPIWLNHVLSARIEGGAGWGWGGEDFPLFERFYLGGPNTFRGVKFRRISPVDETGTRIGGTSYLLGNTEYIIPLFFGIRVAAFFDIGNVYGFGTPFDPTDTREAVGAGIRWASPFGPIRIDYGVLLDRKEGEDFGALHFSVGSPF